MSNAGRDWTYEIAHKYCKGSWCLTLDVDEFLVYPNIETLTLKGLTAYLDARNYEGVFSIFLDFYSNSPLSATEYKLGQSPFEVCTYYDPPSNYYCYEREIFPHIEIKGGPRQRKFWPGADKKVGPSMRKLVLIKWGENFQYTHSTHSCVPIRLADITGAVAHFKFLSHFAEYAKSEVKRNARIANSIDWKVYSSVLDKEDVCFYQTDQSKLYQTSSSLLDDKMISTSSSFEQFCRHHLSAIQENRTRGVNSPKGPTENLTTLDHTLSLWPAISHFSDQTNAADIDRTIVKRFEKDLESAANSYIWRMSYPLRKFASKLGMTDQRSLTEENFYNQNIHARFVFTYKSIWWDLLGPFRVITKVARRLRRRSN